MHAQDLIGGTFTIAHRVESLLPAALETITDWVKANKGNATHDDVGITVASTDGPKFAGHGDWVVLGINGKFATMAHDVFIAMAKREQTQIVSEPAGAMQ